MIKFNGRQILKNGRGLDYAEPPAPAYRYLTFKAYGTGDYTFDPVLNCVKVYTNSYIKDLTDGVTAPLKAASGDAMRWNVQADHVYEVYWAPEDREETESSNPYCWSQARPAFPKNVFKEIYAIDCWDMREWFNDLFIVVNNLEGLPQDSSLITNADNVIWSSLEYLFMLAKIKNNIEPFILKFNSIAVSRNHTFINQTSAPDYSYCSLTYPKWF